MPNKEEIPGIIRFKNVLFNGGRRMPEFSPKSTPKMYLNTAFPSPLEHDRKNLHPIQLCDWNAPREHFILAFVWIFFIFFYEWKFKYPLGMSGLNVI